VSQGGLDAEIRAAATTELPDGFRIDDLRWRFRQAGDARLRRVLHALAREGRLRCSGRGRSARWLRTSAQATGPADAPTPLPSAPPRG
jgi:hypothetical protein